MRVLLDTNIIIEHLRLATLTENSDTKFAVSVISVSELFMFPNLTLSEAKVIDDFLSITTIIPVDEAIARRAATLVRTHQKKLPDMLIAATAMKLDIPLITHNLKDFRKLPSLIVRSLI